MNEEVLRSYIRSVLLERDMKDFKPSGGAYIVPDGVPKPKKKKEKEERNFLQKVGEFIESGLWDPEYADRSTYRHPALNKIVNDLNAATKIVPYREMQNFVWNLGYDYAAHKKFESKLLRRIGQRLINEYARNNQGK